MSSRGLKEADWEAIAGFLHEVLQVCKEVQASSGKLLKDFLKALEGNEKLADIKARVEAFSSAFPMPGFDVSGL
jgi:glycine hydroxymethyltransferase